MEKLLIVIVIVIIIIIIIIKNNKIKKNLFTKSVRIHFILH